jgi:PAS domain S-box-containing protein
MKQEMNTKQVLKKELKTKLQPSLEKLMERLIEAEETIEAIRYNRVDALVISTRKGEQVWTLKDTEQPYRVLIEQINEGAVTISNDGTILFSNNKFPELLQTPFEYVIGSSIFKWFSIADLNSLTYFLHENVENSRIELNLLRMDGTLIPVSVVLTRLSVDEDIVICLNISDLTEQRKFKEISEAEKLARSVIEQAGDAIIVCDENKKIIRVSRGAEKLAGEQLLNVQFDSVFHFQDGDKKNVIIEELLKQPLPFSEEVSFQRKDGENFYLIFNAGTLSGTENKTLGFIITLTNITSHVAVEEKITASLHEKTVLLKEIHHRVKNNLQMISSLLNIQSTYVKYPEVKEMFLECQQRIGSIALIHKKLYETKSISSIAVEDYIRDMVRILCSSHNFDSRKVVLNFPRKKILASAESAVPIGLIINELITNCFKHAFKNKPEDRLTVTVEAKGEKQFSLSIMDNGPGFPENINWEKVDTLGLQLVHMLVDQLEGSLTLIRGNGTEFRILLPKI